MKVRCAHFPPAAILIVQRQITWCDSAASIVPSTLPPYRHADRPTVQSHMPAQDMPQLPVPSHIGASPLLLKGAAINESWRVRSVL